jgi:hypothetical protein
MQESGYWETPVTVSMAGQYQCPCRTSLLRYVWLGTHLMLGYTCERSGIKCPVQCFQIKSEVDACTGTCSLPETGQSSLIAAGDTDPSSTCQLSTTS